MKYKCLSIAGFDGSGGAGIQADLKTFSVFGCYGMNVLTALPIQNTCGVKNVYNIPLTAIYEQLEAIFEDIVPDSIKIGMLFSSKIIELVADYLEKNALNIPIILDPVMVASSGDLLLQQDAITTLKNRFIPLATLITPNLLEAYTLTKQTKNIEELANELLNIGFKAVLIKGGHSTGVMSNDFFIAQDGQKTWLNGPRVNSNNTHGTGCTLSAAICACLALGYSLQESCKIAKKYLFGAIKAAKNSNIGQGAGPVNHLYNIKPDPNIV
jgi:hydroxymethylpyrimidine/phosphomethylpyrimidine kinase